MRIRFPIVAILLAVAGINHGLHPCTIFYVSQDDMILGCSNEDWSDPKTMISFYPPENGKNGWVKFGFHGGYPQAGMNDQGLFWDATAGPYLEMPYSEANKEEYDGSLMQKVIEECATVQEALCVFEQYYCHDQYRAQYLVGDTTGTSAIVEGDDVLLKEGHYQVLTNFYQSHPELGGYPCWRYETAVNMLESNDEISTYLCGSILSATHQEGRYPTQYSIIYDLREQIIHLIYYHNFEEFASINVLDELQKGSRTYDIGSLFSKIEILFPTSDEVVDPSSVTFKWNGKIASVYDLQYSTDPSFTEYESARITARNARDLRRTSHLHFLLGGLLLSCAGWKLRHPLRIILVMLMTFIAFSNCGNEPTSPTDSDIGEMSETVQGLQPDTTYYWRLISHTEGTHDFSTESLIHTFATGDQ